MDFIPLNIYLAFSMSFKMRKSYIITAYKSRKETILTNYKKNLQNKYCDDDAIRENHKKE